MPEFFVWIKAVAELKQCENVQIVITTVKDGIVHLPQI